MPRAGERTPVDIRLRTLSDQSGGHDSCWLWRGATARGGYGKIKVWTAGAYKTVVAHRVSYELVNGPVPSGLTLDHLCRNTRCINPSHLEPVTIRQNILRGNGRAAQNARKTHCPQGHPFDDSNTLKFRNVRLCRTCRAIKASDYFQRVTKHKRAS